MKYFRLAGRNYRENFNLKDYESDIVSAVKAVKKDIEVVVVGVTYYYTVPELSKRESIKVSTILRNNSLLEKATVYRPCLFNSSPELTEEESQEQEAIEIICQDKPKKSFGSQFQKSKINISP